MYHKFPLFGLYYQRSSPANVRVNCITTFWPNVERLIWTLGAKCMLPKSFTSLGFHQFKAPIQSLATESVTLKLISVCRVWVARLNSPMNEKIDPHP